MTEKDLRQELYKLGLPHTSIFDLEKIIEYIMNNKDRFEDLEWSKPDL